MAGLADRVIVMYAGFVVEEAPVEELYANPQHPYTLGLMNSLPRIDRDRDKLANIEGAPPDMLVAPTGCPFAARCAYVFDRCREENPALLQVNGNHCVACWWDVFDGRPRDE